MTVGSRIISGGQVWTLTLGILRNRRRVGLAMTVCVQLLSLLLSLVTFKLAASYFDAAGFGLHTLARRAISVITFPLLVGLGTSIPRFITQYRDTSGSPRPGAYALAGLVIAAPILTISLTIILCLPNPFARMVFGNARYAPLTAPTLAAIVGLYLHMLTYAILVARFRTVAASFLQVFNVAAAPALTVAVSGGDVASGLFRLGVVSSIASIVTMIIALRGLGLRDAMRTSLFRPVQNLLIFGIPRVPGELALFGLFAIPAFTVASRTGVEGAGLFSFGISMLQLVGAVFAAGSVLMLPMTGKLLAEGRTERVGKVVGRIAFFATVASVVMVGVLEWAFEPFVGLILGPARVHEAMTDRWVLLGAVPYVMFIVLRGPLDAIEIHPHSSINLVVALLIELLLIACGIGSGSALLIAMTVLGTLMWNAWRLGLRRLNRVA